MSLLFRESINVVWFFAIAKSFKKKTFYVLKRISYLLVNNKSDIEEKQKDIFIGHKSSIS